jgi:uncharacterized phage infection (PIP) family protein YhgE
VTIRNAIKDNPDELLSESQSTVDGSQQNSDVLKLVAKDEQDEDEDFIPFEERLDEESSISGSEALETDEEEFGIA